MKVLVTGAAGFIGGQTVLDLADLGHEVLAIDIRPPAKHLAALEQVQWLVADYVASQAFDTMAEFAPVVIMHCAGTSLVGPSHADPAVYYQNNFVKTKQLVDFMLTNNLRHTRLVFSSSAAAYGEPVMTPCQETDPTEPISPYGESKLMTEWLLRSYGRAHGLDWVAFRYFNACGADSQARHGQEPGATHVLARLLESVQQYPASAFVLNGEQYATADGTCVRDYLHVQDISRAHVWAMDRAVPVGVYNLGTGQGHSTREIMHAVCEVTGLQLNVSSGLPRPGDPAVLTADSSQFQSVTDWRPQHDLADMIGHAWAWYRR